MDRGMLNRATEGTDAPTPGYLYVDLCKAATSNPTACAEMAQFLTRRLQSKQNPNIKAKCCKVITKLCEGVPRNQFRRCIAQDPHAVAAIKETIQFRGPMDPVQGDTKNERVRTNARQALDAVYADAPSSELQSAPSQNVMGHGGMMANGHHGGGMGGIASSYGQSPHSSAAYSGGGGGGGGGSGGRRMEGIGNPMFQDPRNDPRYNGSQPNNTIGAAVAEAGEVILGMIKDPLARNIGVPSPHQQAHYPQHQQQYNPQQQRPQYGAPGSYGRAPPGSAELARQTGGQWTMASNRGPGAVNYNSSSQQQHPPSVPSPSYPARAPSAPGGVGGSWASASVASQAREPNSHNTNNNYGTPSITISHNPQYNGPSGNAGTATSDGSYEKNLILELCPPGGLKAVPPADKLATFARAVPTLNADLISPALLDLIEDGQPWIIRAKALCVMETAVKNGHRASADGSGNLENPYSNFFYACQGEIMPLAQHPRPAIAEPAKRVLQALGLSVPSSSHSSSSAHAHASAPVAAAAAAAAPAPNLLDFDDDPAPAAPAPPPSSAPPPPTVAPPAAAGGGGGSMFGGMQIKGAAATAPVANGSSHPGPVLQAADASSSEAPPIPSSSSDLLDFAAMGSAASNVATDTSSMFGQLSVKDNGGGEDKKTDEDAVASAVPAGGSAFGFINNDAGVTSPSPTITKETFDPLKNLTPNTQQRRMMQLSQEQMQAMAYQQMMMQQQMMPQQMMIQQQMMMQQQMVMAAAMQQHHHPAGNMMVGGGAVGVGGIVPPGMVMRSASGTVGVMVPPPGGGGGSFNFAPRPAKQDDKKFDFVKDAMTNEKKH